MRPSNRRQILESCFRTLRQVVSVGAAVLIGFSATGSAHAQTLTGTDVHLTSGVPTIVFEDNVGTPYQWNIRGSSAAFEIIDVTNSSAIPFSISAGAPANSLRVLQSGYVGFGKFPETNLHVFTDDIFPPALRLENSNIFGTRAWDLRGSLGSFDVVDVTNSSATPFGVTAGAPTNSLFVAANGSIGMGTATPDAQSKLDVRSTLLNGMLLKSSVASGHFLRVENTAGIFRSGVQGNGDAQFGAISPTKGLNLLAGGTSKMTINSAGQISFGNPPPAVPVTDAMMTSTGAHLTVTGVWTDNSSRAAKQDIEPITSEQARDTVRALQPMTYRYKVLPEEPYAGFIAEDVPELVATSDRRSLAPMDFVAVLTKVVQDQDKQLGQQQQLIEQQQAALKELTRQMAELKQMVVDGRDPAK